ncbi:hypothetical protein AMJ39_07200 [candidate division TA06 bacterium DG_24]|uniref:Uncharacterized protein n=1 Tax=candidate division TA06 bacterium DG_24 TaxID=1703770 RepID=A0A0S7WRB6_UNCT6|nr:MAG: hypothetical protein AMJ39_07200 [candidate division TA06 bacterium DG_24]
MVILRTDTESGVSLLFSWAACLALALLLTSAGCFKEPAAPSWDVRVAIPLINETQTVLDIVAEEEYLTWDSLSLDSLVYFAISDSIGFGIGDEIRTQPVSQSLVLEVGEFELGPFGPESLSVGLVTLCPECEPLLGTTSPVPPFAFSINPVPLPTLEDFDSLLVASCLIIIEMQNNLPIPLDAVSFTIMSGGTDIAGPSPGLSFAPGETQVETLQVAPGSMVRNPLAVIVAGQSPGSGGGAVYIPEDAGLELAVSIFDLVLIEAWAQFDGLSVPIADTIGVQGVGQLDSARIYQGTLSGWVASYLTVNCRVDVSLPEIRGPSGQSLFIGIQLPSGEMRTYSRVLDGYTVRDQGGSPSDITLSVEGELVLNSGGQTVHISQDDYVELHIDMGETVLDAAWGVLTPHTIHMSPRSQQVDLPDGLDAIEWLADPRVLFEICRNIDFPVSLDSVRVTGESEGGDLVSLSVDSLRLPPNPLPVVACTTFVFDNSNSNIRDFLLNLPELVEASGTAMVGDGLYSGSIERDDSLHGRITCTFPLILSLRADTVRSEPQAVELSEDVRELIRDHLTRGEVIIIITNHLPFGAGGTLYVGADSATVFDDPLLVVPESGATVVSAAPVGQDSLVSSAVADTIVLGLDESDVRAFDNDELYTGVEVVFEGTGGQVVKVQVSDYIRFTGVLRIVARVKGD